MSSSRIEPKILSESGVRFRSPHQAGTKVRGCAHFGMDQTSVIRPRFLGRFPSAVRCASPRGLSDEADSQYLPLLGDCTQGRMTGDEWALRGPVAQSVKAAISSAELHRKKWQAFQCPAGLFEFRSGPHSYTPGDHKPNRIRAGIQNRVTKSELGALSASER